MSEGLFQQYLSQVASRLRHDLKGGLITLKMGLESLPEEEGLKEPLLEKATELVDLSDKLILLLRMGEMKKSEVRPSSLFRQAANQLEDRYPPLKIKLKDESGEGRWLVDPDAVTYALLELAENAKLAGAATMSLEVAESGTVTVTNDGEAFPDEMERLQQLGQSGWERSGLGLSIVESCMQQHQGEFSLERETSGRPRCTLKFGLDR